MLLSSLLSSLLLVLPLAIGEDCKGNEWQCSDGTCLKRYLRCNSKKDCPYDSSDEEDCDPTVTCSPRDFVCDNGHCMSASVRCNKLFDCADMSDETNCEGVCLPGNFLCSDKKCIPESQRCDNHKDCSDDELHCVGCPSNEFQCTDKTCIPIRMRCNGFAECKDKSDELNCPSGEPNGTYTETGVRTLAAGGFSRLPMRPSGCRHGRCDDSQEGSAGNVGDGGDDGSRIGTGESGNNVRCTEEEFQCADNTCVPIEKRCDGYNDCVDQSDEKCSVKDSQSAMDSSNVSCNHHLKHVFLLYTCVFVIYLQIYL